MEEKETLSEKMTPAEITSLLSSELRDLAEKKTTMRHAMAVSRMAIALAKVIEISDLKDRVEFIEQSILRKRKSP